MLQKVDKVEKYNIYCHTHPPNKKYKSTDKNFKQDLFLCTFMIIRYEKISTQTKYMNAATVHNISK